ncbi:phosphate ABC transporter substrate-binding protein [Nostoc sp. C057]|jgi:phosphate transport system substrate-binding protein|uniref:substrate-binding domain-containing protein n=1 Tax=Nostoc sp. C057 TaxID=2576903 RepID=UPI0015C3FEBB|nr:substrate-binding domain-containing protein [Nostoc sp. C057]QLE50506.1 phosphate ABC transporter substrate-binding protein [Nostoc sp. C057]
MKKIAESTIIAIILLGLCSCNSVKTTELKDSNPVTSQTDSQDQKLIKIGGSSSTVTVLKLLAKGYESQNKTVKIEFISNSQSEGVIAALKNNIIDIAGSSHKLKPEEDNGKIQYREFAQDLLLIATHNSVKGVNNLSTKQLKAIYKGEIKNWRELGGPDANIVVLDRPEDESAKKLLRKYYLGEDKTTTKAVILNKEGELIETLQSTPNSIGAFSLAYSLINQLPVNHLSLNGVAPKSQNFSSGQYTMVRRIGILWNKTPSAATQNFIDFILSKEGEKLLQNNGFVPTK